jgi:hypothetical protein
MLLWSLLCGLPNKLGSFLWKLFRRLSTLFGTFASFSSFELVLNQITLFRAYTIKKCFKIILNKMIELLRCNIFCSLQTCCLQNLLICACTLYSNGHNHLFCLYNLFYLVRWHIDQMYSHLCMVSFTYLGRWHIDQIFFPLRLVSPTWVDGSLTRYPPPSAWCYLPE